MERKQFTFYESFFRAVSRIRDPQARCEAYDTVCRYALAGEVPDLELLSDVVAIFFELIRPTLDSSRLKAESGGKGGARKQTGSKKEAKPKQEESKHEANGKESPREKEGEKEEEGEIENENEKENENENEYEYEDECLNIYAPPSVEQVAQYCKERGNRVNPSLFVDYYSAVGWRVGKVPMWDWRAAVRTWEQRKEGQEGIVPEGNPFLNLAGGAYE